MTADVAGSRVSSRSYEPSLTVATDVRREMRALLAAWDVAERVLVDALLVIEEFVANVVDHARTAFDITVEHLGAGLRVAVRDRSDRPAVARPVDPGAARGRGLQLVGAVADGWGCDWHDDGKTVWAQMAA